MQVTFGAVAAQIPGLFCGELHRRSASRNSFTFLVAAFIVAVLSLLLYIMYAIPREPNTTAGAGQMHVIFVPVLLVVLSVGVYGIAAVVSVARRPA